MHAPREAHVPVQAHSQPDPSAGPIADAAGRHRVPLQPHPLHTASMVLLSVNNREKLDKERLKALGMGAFASYGVISNLNYGTALT